MDWINNKLYYVERGVWDQHIGVVDITTSKHKVLPIDIGAPYDIIVDPTKRFNNILFIVIIRYACFYAHYNT